MSHGTAPSDLPSEHKTIATDHEIVIVENDALLHDEIDIMSGFAYRAKLFSERSVQCSLFMDEVVGGLALEPARRSRTARILDSLAQVAVSETEVFAVGAADPSLSEITFKFAANEGVPGRTREYLARLLDLLQRLAKAHQPKVTKADPDDDTLSKNGEESQEVRSKYGHSSVFRV